MTSLSGYYSTRGQFSFSQSTEVYFDENRLLVAVPFSFGSLVEKYWGTGNRAPEVMNEDYDVLVIEGEVVIEGITGLSGFARDGFVYRGSSSPIPVTMRGAALGSISPRLRSLPSELAKAAAAVRTERPEVGRPSLAEAAVGVRGVAASSTRLSQVAQSGQRPCQRGCWAPQDVHA